MGSLNTFFSKLANCFIKRDTTGSSSSASTIRIGILVAGNSPEELRDDHGTYEDMIRKMFHGKSGDIFMKSWEVYRGDFPESIEECDAWIITGSKASAYETESWIRQLKALINEIYAGKVPLVGICFGHQIITQALGGQVVDTGEFVIGIRDYDFEGRKLSLIATHGDQVKKLPKIADVTVVGSASYCKYMALKYGDSVFSIQVHPEFTLEYLTDAIALRNGEPEQRVDTDSQFLVDYITSFLTSRKE